MLKINTWFSNSTLRFILTRIKSRDSHRYCTLMFQQHYAQQPKWKENPKLHWWINKPNVFVHTITHFSTFKMKLNSDTRYNMNEPWKHYAKWKKVKGCHQIGQKKKETSVWQKEGRYAEKAHWNCVLQNECSFSKEGHFRWRRQLSKDGTAGRSPVRCDSCVM